MKTYNRKIYIHNELRDIVKNRTAHMDDGIPSDPLIPDGVSFDTSYNRNIVKKITRISEFFKKSSSEDIEAYLNKSDEIISFKSIFDGLYGYSPKDSYFILVFLEIKNRIREDEYKFLSLLPKSKENLIQELNIKELASNSYEWLVEYIPTETQKRIANTMDTNIVLGAAGTGKTDVAIHSYINSSPLDNIKNFSIRDNVFITFSERLSNYVNALLDEFWNDSKNPIKKNVYTTKDFFLSVLASSLIPINGYQIMDGIYVKEGIKKYKVEDTLSYQIASLETFITWMNEGYSLLNKAYIPLLEDIKNKYGKDYPYLFFRGIYKGKIINKATDKEIMEYFTNKLNLSEKEFLSMQRLLDNYAENMDLKPDMTSFRVWHQMATKRYSSEFKAFSQSYRGVDEFYTLMEEYYDFANPIQDLKKSISYLSLFEREALLIEGYRGETRKDFKEEISVLFEMCNAYQRYLEENSLYDTNDLCYLILLNFDKIMAKGSFKNILVDEFQDMTEREIHTLVRLNDMGSIHIFGDFEQTINPTFLQMENIETIFMVNGIEDYKKQILSSSFRYSSAICRELEALREKGKKIFGTEDQGMYLPLLSNVDKEFETQGNLLFDMEEGEKILKKISTAKDMNHIMYITADFKSKQELMDKYKIHPDKIFTVSESKGREEDFVIVYKVVTNKAREYENLFTLDNSYSRAGRIFYNQLYVGITRCKVNFLEIEDGSIVLPNTKKELEELISPLLKENVDLFLEELLSEKTNFYFRARDSFRNLDFIGAKDNLAFYSGVDYDSLRETLEYIFDYKNGKDKKKELASIASSYKEKKRYELARVIYTVLDNNDMITLTDICEMKKCNLSDDEITKLLKRNKELLCNLDIEVLSSLGFFERKSKETLEKISKIHVEVK